MDVVRRCIAIVALSLVPNRVDAQETSKTAPPTTSPRVGENERGGLLVGVTGGLALGTASGYPNDLQKIDDPRFFGAGGFMVGESSGAMIMGAFARELSFGVWVNQSALVSGSGKWKSNAYGGGFRLEVFPFGWFVPALRDLGLIGQFGVGGGALNANEGAHPGAEGIQSYIGAGAFYEWLFLHPGRTRWVLGPSIEYQLVTSRPFDRNAVMFGLRFAFYSGR